MRRVLWKLVDQASMLQAIGVPQRYAVSDCTSSWMCGSPLETKAGSEAFRYSVEAGRDELKATSYAGGSVVMLQVSGSIAQTAAKVLAQAVRQAGFVVDEQVMDWGTVLARRAKKDGLGAICRLFQWHRHDLAAHALLCRQHLRRLTRMELRSASPSSGK